MYRWSNSKDSRVLGSSTGLPILAACKHLHFFVCEMGRIMAAHFFSPRILMTSDIVHANIMEKLLCP